ncbi:MAG: sulfotransferase family protein, partial [Alphaproteobacteria bacterium]|nr:sulfotransferase family protein [Alphaproteobacteria bacterium]
MQQLTPAVADSLREAIALAQRGDPAAARSRAETALRELGSHGALHAFLGMLCCQTGDLAAGLDHLRAARAANPEDATIAGNLATVLIEKGAFAEASELYGAELADRDATLRLWRLRAYVLQQLERHEAAADAYRTILARAPADWESWNNLGNALAAASRLPEAIEALERAARLRPDSGPIQLNLAGSLSHAGRFEEALAVLRRLSASDPSDVIPLAEMATLLRYLYRDGEALEVLERAVELAPLDAGLWVDLADQRVAALDFAGGELALREALSIAPAHAEAIIRLALLLENVNREEQLPRLLREAEQARVERGVAQFIRALICRRERSFEQGLAALAKVPEELNPIVRAQLEGQFRDRLGDTDGAYAAFSEMNRLFKQDPSGPERRGAVLRASLRGEADLVTPAWYAGWKKAPPDTARPAPVFLVGFPRSGTTLLDTMLMGHPNA